MVWGYNILIIVGAIFLALNDHPVMAFILLCCLITHQVTTNDGDV